MSEPEERLLADLDDRDAGEHREPDALATRMSLDDAIAHCPDEYDRAQELMREAAQLMEAER